MKKFKNTKLIAGLVALVIIAIAFIYIYFTEDQQSVLENNLEIIADNLNVPWSFVFLPDGEILIAERPGTLYFVKAEKRIAVENVLHAGEGGLLGLALHPDFLNNRWIYLYFTTEDNGKILNKIERHKLENNLLSERKVILDGIAGAQFHDGGRMAFGPDGFLYATTGDAGNSENSQNINSVNGKILRLKDDGTFPQDNPFSNAVFAYGFRNPQGLAWDDQGRLFATDHGRSGVLSGFDELNLVEKGKNYGWPEIQGDQVKEGMTAPIINSGPAKTWAPAGLAFSNGNLYFGGLRGEAIFEYNIKDDLLKEYFKGQFGRIRDVVLGPGGSLYFTTSNKDGRGTPKEDDDKLIKIGIPQLKAPISNWENRVTKNPFGNYISPGNAPFENTRFTGYHTGVDFEILPGEEEKEIEIYAICHGALVLKQESSGYGGVAVQECLLSGEYITVIYGHLAISSITWQIGQPIEAEDKMGILGKGFSGETDGERKHLHLGIHKGKSINIIGYAQSPSDLAGWINPIEYF